MKIFAVGDVCGSVGCKALKNFLPRFKAQNNIDMVIVNGENSADGNGITPLSADMIFESGAFVITGGNHSLRRPEAYSLLDDNPFLLRPDNLAGDYGKGYCLVDYGFVRVAVINLSGKIYLEKYETADPFTAADTLVKRANDDGANIIMVDFHAEATSEKRALGIYLDGRVSGFFGTHTHVQTADEQILKNGTGYITDIGMTGPADSVLGVKSEIIIARLKDKDMSRFELADGKCVISGCIFDIDNKTGKTVSIERVLI